MSEIVAVPFEEEVKKNPELKKSDIKYLKEWKMKEPHLPNISDSSLALFLHSNYYLIEPTKITIDNYYTLRTHTPEFFADRDPLSNKDIREGFQRYSVLPLERTTKEGYNVLYVTVIDPDPTHYTMYQFAKLCYMVLDIWIYASGTTKGHLVLFDVKDISLGFVSRVSPVALKKFLFYLQEGLPVRLKGLHFFNITPAMELIFKIMKPMLKKEILENLHIHTSVQSLNEFIPTEILPNELGGKAGQLMKLHEAQIKEVEKHRDWFLQEESRNQVDEKKRPGKAKSASELFGVEGSFKKIDID